MRLINSYLSEHELKKQEIDVIHKLFEEQYAEKIEVISYKYDDRKYFETDFDVIGIEFLKEKIYEEINTLIKIHEKALQLINQKVEIIVANDDTDSEIRVYEKNCDNVSGFGLFITKRKIEGLEPYYSSDICNAYLNFEHVSFGVIFD